MFQKMKACQGLPLALPASGVVYSMNSKDFYRGLNRLSACAGDCARDNHLFLPTKFCCLMTKFAFDSVKKKRKFTRADDQAFNMQDNTLPAFDLFSADKVVHSKLLS